MRAWLTTSVPRWGVAALLVALVAVPVVFTRRAAEAFMVPKVTLLWLCLIVVAWGLVVEALATRRWPVPRLRAWLPLGFLVGWTAIATAFSTSPATSLLGRYARYDGLLGTLGGALVMVAVVAHTWRDPGKLRAVAIAIVAGAALGHAYVNVQQLGWDWVPWLNDAQQPLERPYGLLGNSNFSGAHLAIALPLLLLLRDQVHKPRLRLALLALSAVLLLGVWWTGTRGGLLAAVGGVAVAGLLAPELVPRSVRWASWALTVVALALMVQAGTSSSLATQDAAGTPRFLQGATLVDRREIWDGGLRMAADHPLVGVGPDAFGLRYTDYRRLRSADAVPINADEAHNIVIDRLATAGIPAAASYLWLVGLLAAAAWRARRTIDEQHRWLLAGFGGAFAGYLLQAMVSIDVVPLALLGWTCAGALASLADPGAVAARADDAAPVAQVRAVRLSVLAASGAAAVVLAGIAVRPLVADAHLRRGLEAANVRNDRLAAVAEVQTAISWLDQEPSYHRALADQLVIIATTQSASAEDRRLLLEEAVIAYRDAADRSPGDIQALRPLARTLVLLADADASARDADLLEASTILGDLVARVPADASLR